MGGRRTVLIAYIVGLHAVALLLGLKAVHAGSWFAAQADTTMPYGYIYEGIVKDQAKRSAAMEGAVVAFGDSRIAAMPVSRLGPRVENFGTDGDNLDRGAYRLRRLDLSKASKVVVSIGWNEWHGRKYRGFRARYSALLGLIPETIPTVAVAILPVNPAMTKARSYNAINADGSAPLIVAANRDIEAVCKARPRCTFVPSPIDKLTPDLTDDGVHLTPKGYDRWVPEVAHAITPQ